MMNRTPNVLLVVLDSVRAENTSLHGYDRNTTPFLNTFAKNATVYTQARAPGMTSLPSHTSIFTGLEVEEHSVHDLLTHQLDPTHTIWHTLGSEYEYTTGVFSDNVNLTGDESLGSAFDHVVGRRGRLFPEAPDPDVFFNSPDFLQQDSKRSKHADYLFHCLRNNHAIRGLANGAAKQLSRSVASATLEQRLDHSADRFLNPFYSWIGSVEGPWAACINLMDTHLPFYPKTEHNRWGDTDLKRKQANLNPTSWKVYGGQISLEEWAALEDLYDGTIRQADHYLESLIRELKRRGEFDDTLLVITSDHGEGFGEYSRVRPDFPIVGHIVGLHESILHVPLIVSFPGQSDGTEVSDLATLRRFPDMVKSAITGECNDDEFVPDGPVIASASTVDLKMKNTQRAGEYCDNIEPYRGPIRTVYRTENGVIRKYLTWRDDSVTVEIKNAQSATVIEDGTPHTVVENVFEKLSDAGVASQQYEVGEKTLDHLESLGYV